MLFALHVIDQIVGHHRNLLAYRCSSFGIGGVDTITQAPNIGVKFVAQGMFVHVDPASAICQRAVADEIGGALRRAHVQQIKIDLYREAGASGINIGKGSDFAVAIHFYQVVSKLEVGVVALDVILQSRHKFLDPKQHGTGIVEIDCDIGQRALTLPVIG